MTRPLYDCSLAGCCCWIYMFMRKIFQLLFFFNLSKKSVLLDRRAYFIFMIWKSFTNDRIFWKIFLQSHVSRLDIESITIYMVSWGTNRLWKNWQQTVKWDHKQHYLLQTICAHIGWFIFPNLTMRESSTTVCRRFSLVLDKAAHIPKRWYLWKYLRPKVAASNKSFPVIINKQ